MKKKIYALILTALMVTACGVVFTGCSTSEAATESATESGTSSASSSASSKTAESATIEFATTPTISTEVEAAIKDNKLTVDKDGNITDEKGNKIKPNEDGEIEIKTSDGKTITTNVDTVKYVNNGGNSSSTASSKPSSSSSSASTSSTVSSKPSSSSSSATTSSTASSKPSSSSSSSATQKPATSQPTASKTWHEAEYKTVNHQAETKQVWIVDKAAYTYEEPVYEEHDRTLCNNCNADITDNIKQHMLYEINNGGKGSYRNEWVQTQVGTKTVTVPEEGHYETKVVKEAWTEKVLVKEGYWA